MPILIVSNLSVVSILQKPGLIVIIELSTHTWPGNQTLKENPGEDGGAASSHPAAASHQ